jgi:heptosyltransferase-2
MTTADIAVEIDGFGWKPDCRHFVGGLPCRHWRPCPGCTLYDPVTHRILIVMLKRMGDMLLAISPGSSAPSPRRS